MGAGGIGMMAGDDAFCHPLSCPPPTTLQAPRPLGFTFHFCSNSMPVNGHCSVEKDRNVFSLDALFRTFSAWAQELGMGGGLLEQGAPEKEWLHWARKGGAASQEGPSNCPICLPVLRALPQQRGSSAQGAVSPNRAMASGCLIAPPGPCSPNYSIPCFLFHFGTPAVAVSLQVSISSCVQ